MTPSFRSGKSGSVCVLKYIFDHSGSGEQGLGLEGEVREF